MSSISFPSRNAFRIVSYEVDANNCWNVTSHSSGGAPGKDYPQAFFDGKERHLHRVSYEHFIGPITKGMVIMHTCDNRKCINPNHLKAGTINDNNQDMTRKLRNKRGSNHHWAKVNEGQVKEIRKLYKDGLFQREIAERFGIKQMAVSQIVRRKTWALVGEKK
jgi:hypothetical protein